MIPPWLVELLGLEADAAEEAVRAAVEKLMEAAGSPKAAAVTAMQSQMAAIGTALGLAEGADGDAIVAAAKAKGPAGAQPAEVTALQSEIVTLTGQLNDVRSERSREKAEAFVDGEIERGRVGIKPMRDRYVTMHMSDAAGTEELVRAMPVLGPSGTSVLPPETKDGEIALNAEQVHAARVAGVSLDDYRKQLAAQAAKREEHA